MTTERRKPTAKPGRPLDAVGRATRFETDDASGRELWRLPHEDARAAQRIALLGASGVGGFEAGGEDDDGVWLVRRAAVRRLDAMKKGERRAWREAMARVRDVARALDACERGALFPGALRTAEIVEDASRAWIEADALVYAIVGAAGASPATGGTPRLGGRTPPPTWTPPEQAAGAPWDGAANRYVLGLVAYRLIAGALPFGGAGLRHALDDSAEREPPPFDEAVARELRPGVQSFVLSLLAAEARARPRDAASIAKRCDELLNDAPRSARVDDRPVERSRAAPKPRVSASAPSSSLATPWSRARLFAYALPIAIGAIATAAIFAAAPAPAPPTLKPSIAPLRLAGTTAADCVACHAREVAEWERSVMAHAAKSPLFGALESAVEEQIGRDARCPNGAGVLRKSGGDVCRDEKSGLAVTGTGGEHWCVSCHAPGENSRAIGGGAMPAWSALGAASTRAPLRDLLPAATMEGISCAACHTTIGPVALHASRASAAAIYEGNPTWTSPVTGSIFAARPEDRDGHPGISNSGYLLDANVLLGKKDAIVHARAPDVTMRYLRSSEFCGACHDVRLFGSDAIGARDRGEHFKRLRNAYSEWKTWSDSERRAGRSPASCQDCHMSRYPGVCADGAGASPDADCPTGTHFEARPPGSFSSARVAPSSAQATRVASHYFTSVDLPLTPTFPEAWASDSTLDADGVPLGLRARRDTLLRHTFRFAIGRAQRRGTDLEIPIEIENVGAGHRVPAGFSQEREIWVELIVKDARGRVVYEVGKVSSSDADLRDKTFVRVTTSDATTDDRGRPLGLFGADVVDGPDVPAWSPNPTRGGTSFRGKGLVNMQNGFLRCVKCVGFIDALGSCQAAPGQGSTRADRFDDGVYDIDTGECRSNLRDGNELFETYFPVGALDATRGITKAPDAILDTRSAPPGVPLTYTYVLESSAFTAPFTVEARLRFRSFPPFLVRAFADYEQKQFALRRRPSGPQVTIDMLRRIEIVDLAFASTRVK